MIAGFLYIAFGVIAVLAAVMAWQLARARRQFRPPQRLSAVGFDIDLPSVSVCIPARNEQHALTSCLEAVLASTYPKLEILVLDDVSGDETSTLIKSFAQEGVRFVPGASLLAGWLGKNHALQQLLQQASGSYVLFMDVDTRLSPEAIENMVRYGLAEGAAMVSVLPRREDGWRASVVFSPLRYFWEIIFHRRLWPATASAAWLIRRQVLQHRFKGFTAFKEAIQPETKMAIELAGTGEYRFVVSDAQFGVAYEKKWRSQLLTSIRLFYPLLNRKPLLVAMAVGDLVLLLLPSVAVIALFLGPFSPLQLCGATLLVVYGALYGIYTHWVWRRGWLLGALLWPLLVAQELLLVIASCIQYARGAVTWKGRVVTPPIPPRPR